MFIKLKDGSDLEMPEGSSCKDLAEKLNLKQPHQAIAANLNGTNVDLATPLKEGDQVILWNFEDPEGQEIFWHTSAHVLAQAVLRLYPNAKPTIGPPIDGGFYYDFADLQISDDDLDAIEKEMKKIVSENHTSLREDFQSKDEAIENFQNNPYKVELIKSFDTAEPLSAYRQGEFYDLCRGPHLHNLGKIKALKVLKTSGAYWRGSADNEMLTRIYAISFPDRKQLKEHLHIIEEAKKRDHKILGPKLGLFSLREEAPGMPFIHHHGMIIWNHLIDFLRERLRVADYQEIKTPVLMAQELWEKSGHWENYREHMFTSETEERLYSLKPMNCPGCMLYYKMHVHSYRELPLRIGEIGNVHRLEPSGAISGLFRCRSFHQDDAHVFMKPADIKQEIINCLEFADHLYKTFGLTYRMELSTRPEKNTIGSDEEWEIATTGLRDALDAWGHDYAVNEGDGAFYGPKIDLHIQDALNRTWQCGTIQLDMALPRRFDLEYTSDDGSRQRPIMIHRAIFGSIERFFGILIEHFGGRFPLWLSPRQIRVICVADRHVEYGQKLSAELGKSDFLCDVDTTHESVSKKVRSAQIDQVNYILTVGDKEVEHQTLNLRTRNNVVHGEITLKAFLEKITKERENRALESPFTE